MIDPCELCEMVKRFWKYYLLEPTIENFESIIRNLSQQIVLIGTGKTEYFTDMDQVINNIRQIQGQISSVSFEMHDYWQDCIMVSQDTYLVHGEFRAIQSVSAEVLVDMDTRFSILCKKEDDIWKIIHIHHSIPFSEQAEDECYPKKLSEQAKNAIEKANLYQKKSEIDSMTGLYNNETFQFHVKQHLKTCKNGTMFLFDLDKFKDINDSYGHLVGDKTLQLFSSLLQENFNANAIIGRMGGDEFFVFEYLPPSREITIEKISVFLKTFEEAITLILNGNTSSFSVGIASISKLGSSYDMLIHNADKALYTAKRAGGQTYHWQ